jgi:hypothetical protein
MAVSCIEERRLLFMQNLVSEPLGQALLPLRTLTGRAVPTGGERFVALRDHALPTVPDPAAAADNLPERDLLQ